MLNVIIFLPLLAMVAILGLRKNKGKAYQWLTLGTAIIQLVLTSVLCFQYDLGSSELQFVEQADWMKFSLGKFGVVSIKYFTALDGLSLSMLILSAIVMVVATLSSWNIEQKPKGYFMLFLLLNTAVMGCFVSFDLLLFYLFFEFMLLPMYFLIGLWGGPRREYASIKFFLYTLFGSLFILLAMIGLYTSVIDPAATAVELGLSENVSDVTPELVEEVQLRVANDLVSTEKLVHTFDLTLIADQDNYLKESIFGGENLIWGVEARIWGFLLLFIGFAIKLPVVPFHTWLPDAHVEAPTAISVVLAGVLLKVGGYGLIRIAYGAFPAEGAELSWWVSLLGMISILWGAYAALAQKDLKKLIAYSSVSHMGFVLLGIASFSAEGVSGAIYQMFSHGIISAMLFLVVGVLYERTHDRSIENYRGLAGKMPYYTVMTIIAFFASLGLPGFSGFISEIFVFLGAFSSEYVPNWMVMLSIGGIILGAAYYLWTLQRMFFGTFWLKFEDKWKDSLTDLTKREYIMLVPLAILALLFGLFPQRLLDLLNPFVQDFISMVGN